MNEIALIVIGGIVLLVGGLWIPFAIGAAAIAVIVAQKGLSGLTAIGVVTWSSSNSFTLTAVPLFILMAEIFLQTGLAKRLYRGLAPLTVRLPGGLMQTNIIGCAIFAAISGSSVATAAAIGTVALPELQSRGYPMRMAYGSLAAGGTLGILIPPSIAMIIYGTFTETSIVKLFAAGMIPGLLLAFCFSVFVGIFGRRGQIAAQQVVEDAATWRSMLADVGPVLILIVVVLSSLYLGVATPTEAAAVGAVVAVVLALLMGEFSLPAMRQALHRTIRSSSAVLFIVITAYLFSFAMAISGVSAALVNFVASLGLDRSSFLGCYCPGLRGPGIVHRIQSP